MMKIILISNNYFNTENEYFNDSPKTFLQKKIKKVESKFVNSEFVTIFALQIQRN